MTTLKNPAEGQIRYYFRLKDPGSTLTHFAGFVISIMAMPVLLIRASLFGSSVTELTAYSLFMLSMIVLYGASSSYHAFDISEKGNMVLKKIDHLSIFLLIAGSYTPVCICGLGSVRGMILLTAIWLSAAAGMVFKLFWVNCPKYVSSVIYMMMGWMCLAVIPELYASVGMTGFLWLLAGGLFYSAGSVIYARRKDLFCLPGFGNHELFHCFVLAGSFCHYIFMYSYLIAAV